MGTYDAPEKVLEIEAGGNVEKIKVRERFPATLVQQFVSSKDNDAAARFAIEKGVLAFETDIVIGGKLVTIENCFEELSKIPALWQPVFQHCTKTLMESSLMFRMGANGDGSGKGGGPDSDRKKSTTDNVPRAKRANKKKVS